MNARAQTLRNTMQLNNSFSQSYSLPPWSVCTLGFQTVYQSTWYTGIPVIPYHSVPYVEHCERYKRFCFLNILLTFCFRRTTFILILIVDKCSIDNQCSWWPMLLMTNALDDQYSCWPMLLMTNTLDDQRSWWPILLLTNTLDDQCSWWPILLMTNALDDQCSWWPMLLMTNALDDQCSWWPMLLMTNALDDQCSW